MQVTNISQNTTTLNIFHNNFIVADMAMSGGRNVYWFFHFGPVADTDCGRSVQIPNLQCIDEKIGQFTVPPCSCSWRSFHLTTGHAQ